MSLINRMLQDLDRRNAVPNQEAVGLRGPVRPVRSANLGSDWFWRVLALLLFAAVGWVAWIAWQLMPRSVVNEAALRVPAHPASMRPAPAPAALAQPETSPEPTTVGPDRLRLATELTPPASRPAARVPNAPRTRPAQPAEEKGRGEPPSPRVRAEADYRRGSTLIDQGRVSEGMEALRAALAIEPRHEAARQTMVGLLLESKRLDEASRLLKEGLALDPNNAQFATLLARVTVENGDAAGALAILDRQGAAASPERRAFRAALLQRLGRHKEAVEDYRASLSASPGTAAWWVGLGISQQALAQPKDALESFRRARQAGPLSPELAGFVDQRIRQLQ